MAFSLIARLHPGLHASTQSTPRPRPLKLTPVSSARQTLPLDLAPSLSPTTHTTAHATTAPSIKLSRCVSFVLPPFSSRLADGGQHKASPPSAFSGSSLVDNFLTARARRAALVQMKQLELLLYRGCLAYRAVGRSFSPRRASVYLDGVDGREWG